MFVRVSCNDFVVFLNYWMVKETWEDLQIGKSVQHLGRYYNRNTIPTFLFSSETCLCMIFLSSNKEFFFFRPNQVVLTLAMWIKRMTKIHRDFLHILINTFRRHLNRWSRGTGVSSIKIILVDLTTVQLE